MIIHALGKIENYTYTNSLEALKKNYIEKQKINVMEVDLLYTIDNYVVLTHEFKYNGFSEEEQVYLKSFKNSKVFNKFTPLTFQDLLLLMNTYNNLYIITDSKYTNLENIIIQFQSIMNDFKKLNLKHLIDRFIIQVYNIEMFNYLKKNYNFNKYLFTLYQFWVPKQGLNILEDIFNFCKKNKISGIVMWEFYFNDKIYMLSKKYDIPIYLHTVNDKQSAIQLLKEGAYGIYTDELNYDDLID